MVDGTDKSDLYVVGIGASAGGYEAIEAFFNNMPPDSGLAFVIVQHLSPDFKSLMVELLSKHTSMPVLRVEDGMDVAANHIYLIPAKKVMTISGRRLHLAENPPDVGLILPINIFFRSLAADLGDKAIGIVLSGTGSDGTLGIRDIKGAGGMVMVQDVMTSRFDGMPRSAIATGLVDYTLSPTEMPQALVQFVNQLAITQTDTSSIMTGTKTDTLARLLGLVKGKTRFDFTFYKTSTILRRIEKRMSINQLDQFEDYIYYAQNSPTELHILANELLINVTKFFREPNAFEYLKKNILPRVFENRPTHGPIRVWSVGCSTGEEAYSLAIIFSEFIESRADVNVEVKIFATDIDKPSLQIASAGVYSDNIAVDVSPDRLAKYFVKLENGYQVQERLKRMVIFANQNIVRDAPFNKVDFIACRNLLIYFQSQAQKQALSYIHFALKPDSFLFLGHSETVGSLINHFKIVDNTYKIFQKVGNRSLLFSSEGIAIPLDTRRSPRGLSPRPFQSIDSHHQHNFETIYHNLMEIYEPAAILINEDNEVEFFFGDTARFLRMARGRANLDITRLVRSDLSVAVNTAIRRARQDNTEIVYYDVYVTESDTTAQLNLRVRPVFRDPKAGGLLFVIFEEVGHGTTPEREGERYDPDIHANLRISDLENELQLTRENLQATVEELETSNEELQASNEELLTSNEELQSTNEELQSVNEELITVNGEYQNKLEELTALTNDFDNLLGSIQIGTIFLDTNLNIRKFTADIRTLINILPSDIGRPIEHFSHNFGYDNFITDIKAVLARGVKHEIEIETEPDTWHLVRMLPYRTTDRMVEGVVVTVIDISERKHAENKITEQNAALSQTNTELQETLVELEGYKYALDQHAIVSVADKAGKIIHANDKFCQVSQYFRHELIGQDHRIINSGYHPKEFFVDLWETITSGQVWHGDICNRAKDGSLYWVASTIVPFKDANGEIRQYVSIRMEVTQYRQKDTP